MANQKEQPLFIKVKGQYYMLETAAEQLTLDETPQQKAKELEGYFSHKSGGKETVPSKESKKTEKDLSRTPATDKENAQNVADKFTSPDKTFYDGKESKKDLKSFQLNPDTPKEYEQNAPQKMPQKIEVKGHIYELVAEQAPASTPIQESLPDKIKVKGEVYERVIQPPFIRVNGKTFVKLDDAEAREVLAKKSKGWDEPPKGWTKKSMQEYMDSMSGGSQHKVTSCIRKLKKAKNSKIDDPGAFCASLMRKLDPDWTPKGKSKK